MSQVKRNSVLVGVAVLALTSVIVLKPSTPAKVKASDHLDSPQVAQDRAADIGDVYAFLDPNDNSKVVLIMSTMNFVVSSEHFGMVIFDSNLRYRFEIENTGDAIPDAFIDVRYSPGLGRQMPQTATITLPNGHSFTAQTTIATQEPYTSVPPPDTGTAPAPVITTDQVSGAKFFAGATDDPFFLDDTGANRLVASATANPGHPDKSLLNVRGGRDTYAGFNVLLTVVEVPVSMLKGASKIIGINAVAQRQRNQVVTTTGTVLASGPWITVDREGTPLVNNGLIPPPLKNVYNAASTLDDANGNFRSALITSLNAFGTNATFQNKILQAIQANGDILRLDVTVPNFGSGGGNNSNGGFGNMGGRRLQDDVVDAVFTLLNNGSHLGDDVNGNQVAFRNAFPFAHDPIQPFPKGTIDDQTRQ
ncbi:MAG: DUF4331 domain-containing protein [Acidobacteriota bacterium]|nr:DUF4331 domain-containing protein [Acidobacteriota bacterium]